MISQNDYVILLQDIGSIKKGSQGIVRYVDKNLGVADVRITHYPSCKKHPGTTLYSQRINLFQEGKKCN